MKLIDVYTKKEDQVHVWAKQRGASHFSYRFHPLFCLPALAIEQNLFPIEKLNLLKDEDVELNSPIVSKGVVSWDPSLAPFFLFEDGEKRILYIPTNLQIPGEPGLDQRVPLLKAKEKLKGSLSQLFHLVYLENPQEDLFTRNVSFGWTMLQMPHLLAQICKASLIHAIHEHKDLIIMAAFLSNLDFQRHQFGVIVSDQGISFEGIPESAEDSFIETLILALFVDSLDLILAEIRNDLLDKKEGQVFAVLKKRGGLGEKVSFNLHDHSHLFDPFLVPKTIRAFESILTEEELRQRKKWSYTNYVLYMNSAIEEVKEHFKNEISSGSLDNKGIKAMNELDKIQSQTHGLGIEIQAKVLAELGLPKLRHIQKSKK